MRTINCDGCGMQLFSATPHTFVIHTESKYGGYNTSKLDADLCSDCLQFIQIETSKALEKLKSDPEKYKIKYEF